LNVLVLYDARSLFTNTVREHLDSFARYSRHNVRYAHAADDAQLPFPLDGFDVVIVHYSIRLAYDWHLSAEFAWALRTFPGLKALFIQDEYDQTWRACQWIDQLGIRLVFTCVPPEHVRTIYSKVDHSRVTFQQTLTGYLPIDSDLGKHIKPLADRRLVIGYRGRALPFRYGRLAREKLMIGVRMRQECEARGVPCDIEWTEDRRIYGDAWVDFVASCRATLGTESGSNVFDFDGTLTTQVKAALARNPQLTYEEAEEQFLQGRELDGVMNQVSPRIFEAVALKTGLILFEGTYSGVVRPDEHFIPLKKDFGNVEEVLRRVRDDRELEAMTDRAFRHVIGSGLYTYETFVRGVDDTLARLALPARGKHSPPAEAASQLPPPAPAQSPFRKWVARNGEWVATSLYRFSGARKTRARLKQLRAARRLVFGDPVLKETWQAIRANPALRKACGSRLKVFWELLLLGLLRHACRSCPTVDTPVWVTLDHDPASGRITFRSSPVSDLPTGIHPAQAALDRAVAAAHARQVREVVWEFPGLKPEVALKLGKLGRVGFFLGNAGSFRFNVLGRLADLEPERLAAILRHVGTGAHATAQPGADGESLYRRAS
jgi:hypothetical protein